MTLDELTPWLFARVSGGIRWGLDRTEALLAGVGDPHRRFRSLLIGGTNGKGSVAAMCESALRASGGHRTGLYTSPHLVSFGERVRVDGVPVPDEILAGVAARLKRSIEATEASFFEAATAIAFLTFAEMEVDLAVVEVGLGGRRDATNVLRPLASAVTNIGLDHQEYLGRTLAEIAAEKAGILKPGVPTILGVSDSDLVEIFRARAREVGAPLHVLDEVVRLTEVTVGHRETRLALSSRAWGDHEISVPLAGAHQARNAAVAAELLALLPEDARPSWSDIARGFGSVGWPGRLQVARVRGTTYVLDVAHNPDGARVLEASLSAMELPEPWVLLAGILDDKDWRSMLSTLVPRAATTILTTPDSAPTSRRWDVRQAADWCEDELGTRPRVIPEFGSALARATTLAPHGTVIVTGSIHTVGDAMRTLGLPAS